MASSQQVLALIRSHAAGDSDQFFSVAEHVADDAARSGKSRVADEIRSTVARVRPNPSGRSGNRPVPIATPRGELSGLVRASYPEVHLSDLVLGSDLSRRIRRIVREHREAKALSESGLTPRRKFLFSGPPGTGKSMTAAAIAGELGLPLFSILLDGVITKFMGETAAKLRLIFDAMHSARGVYFFDEVDALAARRATDNDVGEARRMLNSFLQFLEEDQSGSVIVAATNHRTLLDPAIFRRFDTVFVYAKPTAEEARQILRNHLLAFDLSPIDWAKVDGQVEGLSQADLVAAAGDAARDAVLDNESVLTTEIINQALKDRASIHSD